MRAYRYWVSMWSPEVLSLGNIFRHVLSGRSRSRCLHAARNITKRLFIWLSSLPRLSFNCQAIISIWFHPIHPPPPVASFVVFFKSYPPIPMTFGHYQHTPFLYKHTHTLCSRHTSTSSEMTDLISLWHCLLGAPPETHFTPISSPRNHDNALCCLGVCHWALSPPPPSLFPFK